MSNAYVKNAMSLYTPNEKKVTRYVSEQTYFTNDAIVGNSNYTFQFPETWAGLPTKRKAVGFRYAKRKVNSYYIWFQFELIAYYIDNSNTEQYTKIDPKGEIKLAVTNENSVEEVIHEITSQMGVIIRKYNETVTTDSNNDRFKNSYMVGFCKQSTKNDGSLNFVLTPRGSYTPKGHNQTTEYRFKIDKIKNYNEGLIDFCKFFNQPENCFDDEASVNKLIFDNVWDRKTLYIHSDVVTNTNYLLMDREGTFYRKPSKIYQYDYIGNVFHIWLSFDGKTKANLLYENVEIALAFFADVYNNYS